MLGATGQLIETPIPSSPGGTGNGRNLQQVILTYEDLLTSRPP